MAEDDLPKKDIVGVVVGGVILFALISLLPIGIMWYNRRRRRRRAGTAGTGVAGVAGTTRHRATNASASAPHNLALNGPSSPSMHQVAVERWLGEQSHSHSHAHAHIHSQPQSTIPNGPGPYAQGICPICRCSLGSCPDMDVDVDADALSHPEPTWNPDQLEAGRHIDRNQNKGLRHHHGGRVVAFNRCGHIFHSECLASSSLGSRSHRYKCPICQVHV